MNSLVLQDKSLPRHTRELYTLLESMAQPTGHCRPTNLDLHILTKYSVSSVQNSINKLCDRGYITKEFIYDEDHRVCGRMIYIIREDKK